MSTRKTFVVAGCSRQFYVWCVENGISPDSPAVCYVDKYHDLYAADRGARVVYFGDYYNRRDIDEIKRIVSFIGASTEIVN